MALQARSEGVLVKHVNGEIVVYDLDAHRAHRLDPTASRVFALCDGTREAAAITALSACRGEEPIEEAMVEIALDELLAAGLVVGDVPRRAADPSRRALLQRLGIGAGAALVLPLVTSIVAPRAANAAPPPPPPPPPAPVPAAPVPTLSSWGVGVLGGLVALAAVAWGRLRNGDAAPPE